jgi:ribonuclease HII
MPTGTLQDVERYIAEHNPGTIVGVDEAGRGCMAGSLVAVAAAVPVGWQPPPGLTDSKAMTVPAMKRIFERFKDDDKVVIGVGTSTPYQIDEGGIDWAQAAAQGDAIRNTFHRLVYPPFVVVDGINPPQVGTHDVAHIICLPKADALVPAVSLASVFAKIIQLQMMEEAAKKYPGYGFEKHAGYPSKAHKAALAKKGPCIIHRKTWSPVRRILAQSEAKDTWDRLVEGDFNE